MHECRAVETLPVAVDALSTLVQRLVWLAFPLLGMCRVQSSYQYALCNPRGAPF